MLLRKQSLARIQSGETITEFRRWQRPTIKVGGTLKTAIGVVKIVDMQEIMLTDISAADAIAAGHPSRRHLIAELKQRPGRLLKITLAYAGEDPRIALRENDELTADEIEALLQQLRNMDARSKAGPWTQQVLSAIQNCPLTPAIVLAGETGFEKEWLKLHVRKLKNLGLTISHHPGYTLSPRGTIILEQLEKKR